MTVDIAKRPEGTEMARSMRMKRRYWVAIIAVGLVGLFGLSVDRWLLNPAQATPAMPSDAIAVNAGGQGERLERALELIDAGVSKNLVLSQAFINGRSAAESEWGGQFEVVALCESPPAGIQVFCVDLDERNTRGEARAFAELASEMNWDTLTLVTETHHLHRAKLLLSRCYSGEIFPIAAISPNNSDFYIHEYLGSLKAYLLERGC